MNELNAWLNKNENGINGVVKEERRHDIY